MKKEEIINYVQNHPAKKVKIAYADIDGVLRGKYISSEKLLSAIEKGATFCDVIMGWDIADNVYDNSSLTGWHTGYPDCPTTIDLMTFRKVPWENDIPFFLGQLNSPDGQPAAGCSRQLLKKISAQANDLGFNPLFSQEFEWFNFEETPRSAQEKGFRNMTPLTPGMFGYSVLRTSYKNAFCSDLFDLLTRFGIPIEGLHTETGPGTYEAAIKYGEALESGDCAVLFKTAVKEIAYNHGIMATFMAKINENLPGCGGHVHQSLWDMAGKKNLFHDADDATKLSATAKSYIAGLLHCMPYILPLFAPTINSYKRLVEGAWAPTTMTWGIDNRTVAIRVLNSIPSACRVETRVIGADVNPYLAMSGCLAAGLYGIRNGLTLDQPPTTGNGYLDKTKGSLPHTLIDATQQMRSSPIATELFGQSFVEHFAQSREWEWRQHLKAVTDWEYKRYFELI